MSLRDDLINSRYLLDGEIEDEMWERVATFVTQKREELVMYKDCIKEMLSKGDIIFNSPILMNAGKSTPLSSACYVLPVEDNIESIMDLQQLSAKIFKLGAGVGADYSRLRPEGFPVGSGGTSSGPCSFMSLVDNLAEVIKSGGKRRAAIMSSLRVDHVDIEKFIKIKENDDKLLNTNISVMITDEFMQGVYAKKEKELRIWNSLIDNAWKRGDPGVIFIDTINRNTNRVSDLLYEGVNACSEFSLYPYESCLIGSINLANLDVNSDECFSELYFVAELVAKCLDNVIDHSWYPDDRVEEAAKKYRRVGVGITGLADCLFNKGLRYGSDEAVEFTKKIMKTIQDGTINASVELAEKYGAFSEYENIIWDTRFLINKPIRNITTTVVAPAGSTSILAGADGSGCEPLFSLAYDRMMRRDKEDWYTVVPDIVQKTFNKYGITLTPEKIMDIKDNGGSVQGLDWVPEELQEYLVTAQDLTPDDHLKMLISVQKFVGASVSKTINLPNSATREDVENIYMTAYENGVKGITVFRDGCKSNQVLRTAKREDPVVLHTKDLPMVMPSVRVKIPTPSGSMYMMTSFYKNKPVEVFCNLGKSGMDDYAYTEALGRVISLCLKRGIPADNIIKTLKGIRGREVSVFNDHYVYSVPDAIAIALGEAVAGYEGLSSETRRDSNLSNNLCPDCNVPLTLDNGCFSCYNCGYSSCS